MNNKSARLHACETYFKEAEIDSSPDVFACTTQQQLESASSPRVHVIPEHSGI